MRVLSWLLCAALAVTAACRRDDDQKAAAEEPKASPAPAAGERMQRRRPGLQAPGAEADEAATAEPDQPQPQSLREARDQHIRDTSAEMRRQVLLKTGKPLPPPRQQSPIRTNGRIDLEKMRAMEDALRKRAAERKRAGQRWQPEPKAPQTPAPTNPAPTAPAPAAP